MAIYKIGDLVNLGVTGSGTMLLVMPVVRVTKTMAICRVGTRIERVNNTKGNLLGSGCWLPTKLWDGTETKPLFYPEIKGEPS